MGRWHFRFEPTAWSELLRQLVILVVVMDWLPLTDGQQDAILMAGSALIATINRSLVAPVINAPLGSVPPPKNTP